MAKAVEAKIIRIGNSQGIRIPKPLLEQARLSGAVQLIAENNQIIIRSLRQPREGWAEQFAEMARLGEDQLLDQEIPTEFDENEWTW
jgi:antitoxin MazE